MLGVKLERGGFSCSSSVWIQGESVWDGRGWAALHVRVFILFCFCTEGNVDRVYEYLGGYLGT